MSLHGQLPLALRFPAEQRFEGFLPADSREVGLLRQAMAAGQRAYISGPSGSGKSHLMLAAAAEADAAGKQVAMLPMATLGAQRAAALAAQGVVELLCIDDLDQAAGDTEAELALFAVHNRQVDAGCCLLYAADVAPDALRIGLPDLRSRLGQCLQLRLAPLDEGQRRTLLIARAHARGLVLDDAALDYLFRRVGRDLGSLSALFERLDRASLAAKRRLTVPFLREVLGTREA